MYLFFVLSAISCFSTYVLFSDVELYSRNSKAVISILYFDIALILILLLLGGNKILTLLNARKNKGSRLTFRLISVFSLLSIVPSVLMCVFSALFFHNGIESWFNERNRIALQESLNVAESYLSEHQNNALRDCSAISRSLEYHLSDVHINDNLSNSKELDFLLDDLCGLKGINAAILLDSSLNIIAHSKYSVNLHFFNISYKQIMKIEQANGKSIIVKDDDDENQKSICAATCFKNADGFVYLLIEKNIDSKVLHQAHSTKNAFHEYHQLLQNRSSLEIAFVLIFFAVGILLLIASISVAIIYSWKIVKPISNLIDVSEDIIKGNLHARAKYEGSYDEINLLSKTFNQMIDQTREQQEDLVRINEQLKERMKFTGSVLAGVSSGVIGVEKNLIYIWNNASEKLLNKTIKKGDDVRNLIPEIRPLLLSFNTSKKYVEKEIQLKINNNILLFLIKIENIAFENGERFVITFDDITSMALTQRKAAWTEVARRVAHEIKNPLTPIQLSAERIRRKYSPQISKDNKTFSELIDVIIRQVGDIKRLIDEFNFFARLPEPVLKECDICEICRQAVFFMQNASTNTEIIFEPEKESIKINADERLIHQSIVNLIQNAINAMTAAHRTANKIWVMIREDNSTIIIIVEDNGPGLPKEKMESLATPYFTLTPKGTGLGLAIVKKIIQDHGGELSFGDSDHGGAKVSVSIPKEKQGR